MNQLRKSLDSLGKLKFDQSDISSNSSHLDFNLLKETIAMYTSGIIQVIPVEKVLLDIQRKTGIPIENLKEQILRYYTQNRIELVSGRTSAPRDMLIHAPNGTEYSHIKVK